MATSVSGRGTLDDLAVSELGDRWLASPPATFLVPDYQRGYRWGHDEVTQLLDDIWECTEERYYLQPVVVKGGHDDEWELVDGQQRLTTLYLIAKFLHENYHAGRGPRYRIRYATRELSADYLDLLNRDEARTQAEDNVDFHHMYEAYQAITTWFGEHGTEDVVRLVDVFDRKVRLLWFEAPDDVSGEEMFRRLNSGRIPLTDAELVKARIISRVDRPEVLAAQWDAFERDLRDPQVWAFAAGGAPAASHIELLLDALADQYEEPPVPRPPFRTFHVLERCIDAAGAQTVWDEVVRLHSLVLGWFADKDLYHHVGYLVATGRATFGELVSEVRDKPRPDLKDHLVRRVRETLPKSWEELLDLSYEQQHDKRIQEAALLLMNVESVRRAGRERFPFAEHQIRDRSRVWSLEHIQAQHAKPLGEDARRAWLDEHADALEKMPDIDRARRDQVLRLVNRAPNNLSQSLFDELQTEILSLMGSGEIDADQVHTISNLALLSRDHNSALGNSAFEVKRRRIITMDRGGEYVPVCTRNLFLKYYTNVDVAQLHYWSESDRKGYLHEMRFLLYPEEVDA